jgi:hypothetical protein
MEALAGGGRKFRKVVARTASSHVIGMSGSEDALH